MMKVHIILIGILVSFPQLDVFSQVFLDEGFEGGSKPDGWTQEYVTGAVNWRYRNGGYNPSDPNLDNPITPNGEVDIARNPPAAYEGNYNAFFFNQGVGNERTKLITPELDMLGASAVELSFYLCQIPWTFEGSTGWDILRVYYKVSDTDPWVLLQEYLDPVYSWEEQKLTLPNPSETYYVAFEGHARWGFGTLVDNVHIEETAIQQLYVDDIIFDQPFSLDVPSGSSDVPVLRADVKVYGNTGSLTFDQITFTSLNSSDADLASDGIKLYSTLTQDFNTDSLLGTPTGFTGGKATFTALSHNLSPGHNYFWLAYDVLLEAAHKNKLDAMVGANDVVTSGGPYPSTAQSPTGDRTIYQTYFHDDFEGSLKWTLTGEFEVDTPTGNGGNPGNPDPAGAQSGTHALGTDLTGLGSDPYDYEADLTEVTAYTATSENLDLLYNKDLNLFFWRYINIEVWDEASIEVSTDDGATWNPIWESNAYINDYQWDQQKVAIPSQYWRSDQFKMRFSLGPTNWKDNYSGWNIDDVFVTGEFISKDVGVSEWIYPQSGSGHSSGDSVTVRIRNYGGSAVTDPVTMAYSFNGGSSWTIDIMDTDIPVDGSVEFTFPTRVDLSQPGLRPSVIARTLLAGDQYSGNDQLTTEIYIVPTYVPPYQEDYEDNDGFWRSQDAFWEFGAPSGTLINSAASGSNSWITGLSSPYGDLISEHNQIVFADGFETVKGWSYSGEFERTIPDGIHLPWNSYGGYYCIGTDLGNGTGDSLYKYENGIVAASAYTATSPALDVSEYSNLELSFASFNAIQEGDSIKLEVSDDDGSTWHTVWQNQGAEIMDAWWHEDLYDIPDELTFTDVFRIRFSLYYSSPSGAVAEGWNVDNILLTGDLVQLMQGHLSSPSFDLTGIQNPMITANLWVETEADTDGANLQYSLDDGENWTPVTNASGYDSYWNWYTGQPVSSLSDNGWSGHTGQWIPVKHRLPAVLAGEGNVQFRFTFAADKIDNQYDGIAVDDVEVMDAPYDADLLAIVDPVNSCELSSNQQFTLTIRNSGPAALEAGDSLLIGYYIDHPQGIQTAEEVYYLPQNLPVGNSLDFTTDSEFDFSESGEYLATVYLQSPNPYFYTTVSADTVFSAILVSKPYVEIGDIISTSQPDTVVLRAYSGEGGLSYLWQDSSTDSIFYVSSNGIYWVRVTNGLGCTASDTVRVVQLFPDVGVTAYLGPQSDCEVEPGIPLEVTVQNLGSDTLEIGSEIIIGGIINGGAPFYDTLTLTQRFMPSEQFNHIYEGDFDFSVPGSYQMRLFTQMDLDENPGNDTLFYNLEVYGYPDAYLGEDTTVNALEYLLSPEPGHSEYLWQDGSAGETFTVDQPGTGIYYVTVTNDHLCSSSDTIEVTLNVADLELSQLLSPSSACEFSSSITVSAMVGNSGDQTLPAGQSITMGYSINKGTVVSEQTTLASDLLPGESFDFSFSESETFVPDQWYLFTVFVDYENDVNRENDTITSLVAFYESSPLDLGEDRVEVGQQYTLDAGPDFVSYLWQDGSTGQTYTITSPGIGTYHVTVTDLNGCTLSDTVKIMLSVPDIGVTEVIYPQTTCHLGREEQVQVAVQNLGNWPLAPSSLIYVSYSVDGLPEVTELLNLEDTLMNGETVYYTFTKKEDFSEPKTYNVVAYTIFEDDIVPANDHESVNFEHYGPYLEIRTDPEWVLDADSLITYEPITLYAHQPYSSYAIQWQDGSTGMEFEIGEPSADWYWVTAEGDHDCTGKDSIYVAYDLPDLALSGLVSPASGCSQEGPLPVSVEITNQGFAAISTADTMTISYSVIGVSSDVEQFQLDSELPLGQSRILTFSKSLSLSSPGDYQVQIGLVYSPDKDLSDNTYSASFTIWFNPVVEIAGGEDTLVTDLPVTLRAGSGFASYLWQDGSTDSTFLATVPDWYWVTVSNEYGCTGTDSVYVTSETPVNLPDGSPGGIRIFPNPVQETLYLKLDLEIREKVSIELYSITRALLYREDIKRPQAEEARIDVQDLTPGMYFLRITTDGTPHHFLVLIE